MQNKRELGTIYEKIVGSYLVEKGYEILCYNYRCYFGEIDIVARQNAEIVFVEVKYRKNLALGNPLDAVNGKKQKTITKCANAYLAYHGYDAVACRFDVVGVIGSNGNEIIHVENAFDAG